MATSSTSPEKIFLRDGQEVFNPSGMRFAAKQGDGVLSLSTLVSVGVACVTEVASHSIVDLAGITTHTIKFRNGGQIDFAYFRERVIHLRANKLILRLSEDGRMLAAMEGSAAMPPVSLTVCAGMDEGAQRGQNHPG